MDRVAKVILYRFGKSGHTSTNCETVLDRPPIGLEKDKVCGRKFVLKVFSDFKGTNAKSIHVRMRETLSRLHVDLFLWQGRGDQWRSLSPNPHLISIVCHSRFYKTNVQDLFFVFGTMSWQHRDLMEPLWPNENACDVSYPHIYLIPYLF